MEIIAVVLGGVASSAITWMIASNKRNGLAQDLLKIRTENNVLVDRIADLEGLVKSHESELASKDIEHSKTVRELNEAQKEAALFAQSNRSK